MNKKFTIYWLHGESSVVSGPTIEQAFASAGYGGGAVNAVDWYDNGITRTHWYDKTRKVWVPFGELRLSEWAFMEMPIEKIAMAMITLPTVVIDLDGKKDQLTVYHKLSEFAIDGGSHPIDHVCVAFLEHHEGAYDADMCLGPDDSGDDENTSAEDESHYMVCNGQYFDYTNLVSAIACAKLRISSGKPHLTADHPDQKMLDELHHLQHELRKGI